MFNFELEDYFQIEPALKGAAAQPPEMGFFA
jgi:hypothetical protein